MVFGFGWDMVLRKILNYSFLVVIGLNFNILEFINDIGILVRIKVKILMRLIIPSLVLVDYFWFRIKFG